MPTLLEFLGWGQADHRLLDVMSTTKNVVVIFPHTSDKWDPILIFAYMTFDREFISFRPKMRILTRGSNVNNPVIGPALKYFGAIAATHPNIKNGGSTKHINDILYGMEDGFILLISPKGCVEKTSVDDWKTGWYHIAKEHDATIIVAGPDFEQHRIIMAGDPMKIDGRSIEEMKEIIKPLYGYIVPYNVKSSEVPVRKHEKSSLFDSGTGQSFMLLILLVLISSIVIILGLGLAPARVVAITTSETKGTVGTDDSRDLT